MRRLRGLFFALPLLATGCVTQEMKQAQVQGALVNAGLSRRMAECMAHRLVDRLTVRQLRKLQAFQRPKHSVDEYLAAVKRVNDPQVVEVAISSLTHCIVDTSESAPAIPSRGRQ